MLTQMNFFAEVYEQVAAETEQDTSPVDGGIYPQRQQAKAMPITAPVPALNLHQAPDMSDDLVNARYEITKYGSRTFAVYSVSGDSNIGGDKRLICVTVYKKGAQAVKDRLDRLTERYRNLQARCSRYEQLHRVA
jgi:hypothetical protein